ncbi:TPA: hypothetical protein ACV5UU_005658, partial [Klebsiella michiganensis]
MLASDTAGMNFIVFSPRLKLYIYTVLFCGGRFFSSHLVAVVCNHLLFLQKQGNFRRITASP